MLKKIIYLSILIIVIIIIIGFTLSSILLKKSFPDYNQEISSELINNNITINRDEYGIPYINAESDLDIAFGLGYAHAQDRLWQMDILRRAGEGRLSEIFGTRTLNIDILARTIDFDSLALHIYKSSSEESKAILKAYANGVNAYIKDANGNYQIEFDLLNYNPEKWDAHHSIIVSRMIAWLLNFSWWDDCVNTKLKQKLTPEKFNQIMKAESYTNISSIDLKKSITSKKLTSDFINQNIELRDFLGFNSSSIGSNCWTVSSNKSKSDKPILASDPHLTYTLPSIWYIANLSCKNYSVSGVSIPGNPGIVIGRNDFISWGMTNLMLDDCDFYYENIDLKKRKYYQNNELKDLAMFEDTIIVKDCENVIIQRFKTERGPLLIGIDKKLFYKPLNKYISVRWTGFEISDEVLTFNKVNKSKSIYEFKSALKDYNVPAQNFICSDIAGNIMLKVAGKIPIRNGNEAQLISESNSKWDGFVSFDDLPEILNPIDGFVASANNPPLTNYRYYLGNLWEPNSRIERINYLLKNKEKHSISDFKNYQSDIYSNQAKIITKYITDAFKDVDIIDNNLKTAMNYLNNWKFEISKYDQTSCIYNYFLNHLIKNTFYDEMDEELFKEFTFLYTKSLKSISFLLTSDKADVELIERMNPDSSISYDTSSTSFFDNIKTKEFETKKMIIQKSMIDALSELENNLGKDIKNWQWGEVHKVHFKHLLSDDNYLFDKLANIDPLPISGDHSTLLNSGYNICDSYENNVGQSMKFISDLSNTEYSEIVITTGQSGHITHKLYSDQTAKWLLADYIKLYNILPDDKIKYRMVIKKSFRN